MPHYVIHAAFFAIDIDTYALLIRHTLPRHYAILRQISSLLSLRAAIIYLAARDAIICFVAFDTRWRRRYATLFHYVALICHLLISLRRVFFATRRDYVFTYAYGAIPPRSSRRYAAPMSMFRVYVAAYRYLCLAHVTRLKRYFNTFDHISTRALRVMLPPPAAPMTRHAR